MNTSRIAQGQLHIASAFEWVRLTLCEQKRLIRCCQTSSGMAFVALTERVSNSPSGEYRADTISCLCDGYQSLVMVDENRIWLVRDRRWSAAQVHRYEYLRSILGWDETALDHGQHDEDADDGHQYQLCDADGDYRGYR